MESEVNTTTYSEGIPTHVNLFNQDYTVMYNKTADGKDMFSIVDVNPADGTIKPHTINNQNAIFGDPESLISTVYSVIETAQKAKAKKSK